MAAKPTKKSASKNSEFKAGVARRNITPDHPELLTPTGMGRLETTIGVLDDLFVEALCFEAGGEIAFIATGDLISVERDWMFQIQDEVAKRVGCDGRRILLCSTHDHSSSPAVRKKTPEAYAALNAAHEKFVRAYIDACVEAWQNRKPAEIAYAQATVKEPIGENRGIRLSKGFRAQCWGSGTVLPPGQKFVGPAGDDPKEVRVVALREVGKKKPFAVLTAYPSHIHLANLPYFSGEFAGAAKREIQRRLGHGLVALYANNYAGDIDVHCIHPQALGDMDELVAWFRKSQKILGNRFADAVVPAVNALKKFSRPQHLRHRYWTTGDEKARADANQPLTVLSSLRLGDIVFMTTPGEVFFAYHERLKKKSPVKKWMLLGYNGTGGWYVPEPLGYELGGYEAMRGPVTPDATYKAVMPEIWEERSGINSGEQLEKIILQELRAMAK